jgi:signal transduction histidine kinase
MARLLIADDHAGNRYLLEALLAGHGHSTRSAADGAEALALATAEDFDLIISDLLMPVMDGFALCRRWKQDPRLARIPFLVYTATYTDPKDEQFALSLGADRFLVKPVEPGVLLEEIELLLSARAKAEPKPTVEEEVFIREHNLTLFRKLEKKLAETERLGACNARLEEELRHLKLVESLGRMVGGVAHDLNNLLAPILGLAGVLLERHGEDPELNRRLGTILQAAERARDMVQGMNDYLRKSEHVRNPVDLNQLASQAVELLQADDGADIRMELDLARGLPKVPGDAGALNRVLMNLGRNALDATPPGGTLCFRTRPLGPDRVELAVQDTGQGIPPDQLKRVMEPFYTTKVLGKGTGLGLAIVKNIVHAHDGTLTLESEVGRGTTVRIELPTLG